MKLLASFPQKEFDYICIETRSFDIIEKYLCERDYVCLEMLTNSVTHNDYLFCHKSLTSNV